MNKLLMIMCLAACFSSFAAAQQPKTVTDFYLALPSDKYATDIEGNKIKGKAALSKFRKSLIKVEDVKNGYLKLEGAWEGWAEIALFKKKDGSYIVAQAESGCGPACSGFVKFFTYAAGKWTDITKLVFPELTENQVIKIFAAKKLDAEESGTNAYFLLPRTGTTIKLACNLCSDEASDFTLAQFQWNGANFEMLK